MRKPASSSTPNWSNSPRMRCFAWRMESVKRWRRRIKARNLSSSSVGTAIGRRRPEAAYSASLRSSRRSVLEVCASGSVQATAHSANEPDLRISIHDITNKTFQKVNSNLHASSIRHHKICIIDKLTVFKIGVAEWRRNQNQLMGNIFSIYVTIFFFGSNTTNVGRKKVWQCPVLSKVRFSPSGPCG